MKRFSSRDIFFYALLVLFLVFAFQFFSGLESGQSMAYSEIRSLLEQEQVQTINYDGSEVTLLLREPYQGNTVVRYSVYSVELFYQDFNELIVDQYARGIISSYDYPEPATVSTWTLLLPTLVTIIVFAVIMFILFSRQNGGAANAAKFTKSNARKMQDSQKKVTFADVAGADEEKEELQDIVEYLRDPKRFSTLGARIPKGVLLVGPPGTGKTLLARATAGEANVNFLSISGSEFVELYVGVGAGRVRDLFQEAKQNAPCIIFIDEIDAVGRRRGAGLGGGHDEREQTLNQMLVEMDGFSSNEGVIVLAATNRQDILDPALTRPGRFDRQVYVGRPDVKGREAILRVHAKGKPLGDDVSLKEIARITIGFTGADLENVMNEAALLAAKRGGRFITDADMREAIMKNVAGPEKKSHVVTDKERKLVSFHEAGHAVASFFLTKHHPVHTITIIPRGSSGGMTIYQPQEDSDYDTKGSMYERIVSAMGGRVAEEIVLEDVSTGASSDLRTATSIARAMVTRYGMSDKVGKAVFDESGNEVFIGRDMAQHRSYSEEVAALIDQEVKRILDEAYTHCTRLLTENRDKLDAIANYLMEHETMNEETFQRYMKAEGPTLA